MESNYFNVSLYHDSVAACQRCRASGLYLAIVKYCISATGAYTVFAIVQFSAR